MFWKAIGQVRMGKKYLNTKLESMKLGKSATINSTLLQSNMPI